MWSWVRHEFSAIGKFIYPLLIANMLSHTQERRIRQLEPVLRMWRKDYVHGLSAAPGRDPIITGDRWSFQADQCDACMLARIGSSEVVLRALYAGMLARFSLDKLTTSKVILAELGVSAFDYPKSKRVRFVRYWIKGSSRGTDLLFSAADLGLEIKKLHKVWKEGALYWGQHVAGGEAQDPFQDPSPVQHTPYTPSHRPHTPTSPAPFTLHLSAQVLPLHMNRRLPALPFQPLPHRPVTVFNPHPRPSSFASVDTIESYDGAPPAWKAHFQGQQAPRPSPPQSSSSSSNEVPSPHRMSMYYGYNDVDAAEADPFDDADEDEGGDEGEGEGEEEWESVTPVTLLSSRVFRASQASVVEDGKEKRETRWGGKY